MDCTAAAWVSVTGSGIELLGILTVAADLLYAGRVPNLKATVRKLLRWPPPVVYGRASSSLTVHSATQGQSSGHVHLKPDPEDVVAQLRRLERRIEELHGDLQREATARAEADTRLERSIQPKLQSLQKQINRLRRDVTEDRARASGRPWIAWAGIAAFVFGLALNTFGAFMSAQCT